MFHVEHFGFLCAAWVVVGKAYTAGREFVPSFANGLFKVISIFVFPQFLLPACCPFGGFFRDLAAIFPIEKGGRGGGV